MDEFVKQKKGEKLKDVMMRASRFTRLTANMKKSVIMGKDKNDQSNRE